MPAKKQKETVFELAGFSRYQFVIHSATCADVIRKADGGALKQTLRANATCHTVVVNPRRDSGLYTQLSMPYVACLAQLGRPPSRRYRAYLEDGCYTAPRWIPRSLWARHMGLCTLSMEEYWKLLETAEKMVEGNCLNYLELSRRFDASDETIRRMIQAAGI